jgi:hypothetical protein
MVYKKLFYVVLYPLFFSFYFTANGQGAPKSLFSDLLNQPEASLYILTDFNSLHEDRNQDIDFDGYVIANSKLGIQFTGNASINVRGKFRRKICEFPPLKLKFSNSHLQELGYERLNEIKLVTHCTEDYVLGEPNLVFEYGAYLLFQALQPNGFRAAWLNITYDNARNRTETISTVGIAIEDKEEMAQKNQMEICECQGVSFQKLNQQNVELVSIFQFLIGNSDWDIQMLRNVELFTHTVTGEIFVFPYDFDFSGFVNPSYALANSDYNHQSIKDRVYLGPNLGIQELKKIVDYITSKEPQLYEIIENLPLVKKVYKKERIAYLEKGINYLKDLAANQKPLANGTSFMHVEDQ